MGYELFFFMCFEKKIDAYLNHIEKELTVAESASTVMDSYIDYKMQQSNTMSM